MQCFDKELFFFFFSTTNIFYSIQKAHAGIGRRLFNVDVAIAAVAKLFQIDATAGTQLRRIDTIQRHICKPAGLNWSSPVLLPRLSSTSSARRECDVRTPLDCVMASGLENSAAKGRCEPFVAQISTLHGKKPTVAITGIRLRVGKQH